MLRAMQPGQGGCRRGFTLVEALVAMAIAGLALALLLPGLHRLASGLRVDLAAGELIGVLHEARSLAIRHSARVGVKFRSDEVTRRVSFTLYRDGDGDGVLTSDIDSGVDPQVAPARDLTHLGRQTRFGFPPGPPPRDPGDPTRRLDNLDDPIRFNLSDIASFGPLGGSTPGSLYLTDGMHHLSVVRVLGATGRIRSLRYDVVTELWR